MIKRWVGARALAMLGLVLGLVAATAEAERQETQVYVFGNSLVHHLSEQSEHTNVPYWLGEMARADGRGLGLDGQWGFLRNFADGLPPTANWSFEGVNGVWSPARGDFGGAGFDAVVVTPANFIQYQLPDVPYEGDNPTGESPLGAVQRLLDWVHAQTPASRLFIYEGWAEMEGVTGRFPPRDRGYRRYQELNKGEYHQWYNDLINVLEVTRPNYDVALIPVASTLAALLGDGGLLEDIPPEALYEDSAPHGTPTLYFLAAMVTYTWLFEAPPPEGYAPPASLHPDLVAKYGEVARFIWDAAPTFKAQTTAPAAVQVASEEGTGTDTGTGTGTGAEADVPQSLPALPERQALVLPAGGITPDGLPSLGFGLNGISDWSTQHPFLDLMKTSRGWVGHTSEQWGAVSTEALRAGGHLDENDWPVSLPDGVTALEAVLLNDQHEGQEGLRGNYVVFFEGSGKLRLTGRARRVRDTGDNRMTFTYAPGEGLVGVQITAISPTDPIRNIVILKEEHVALWEAGALFNPAFLDRIEDARSVRFMDWMLTNGSPVSTWDDRPTMAVASWTEWGVPLEVMIRLANLIGADPWFCMPHRADDAYVRRFAQVVERDLDPRLQAHVEYSNEVWNQIFPQADWARARATELWGASDMGWMQYYALRSAQVMDIWTDVFGTAAKDRLVRVMTTHTGWPELEKTILKAPLAQLFLGKLPVDSFDAYAVTGYFGYEMGTEEWAQQMEAWLDASEARAVQAGEAQGLRRVALREYVKTVRFEGAIAPVAQALQDGSLRQLTEEILPYHGAAARRHGLRLVMYEGGTHVAGHMEQVNNARLTDFFTEFNYTPEMAKLYEQLLAGWVAAGGTLFNAFVDVAPASQWGSWGALRHLEDDNPRWDMLMAFNASGPQWEARDLAAFENGVRLLAAAGRVEGTPHEDYAVLGAGDDVYVTNGGGDVVHGGAGRDKVVLPGSLADYAFASEGASQGASEGARVVVQGPDGTVRLRGVEVVGFSDAPEQDRALADLTN